MVKYRPGEIVDIVGGTYKKYKTGTFQRKAGIASASITVHGIEETHSIWLSSIKKRPVDPEDCSVHEIMRAICQVLWLFNCWTFQVSFVVCTDSFVGSM